MWSDLSWITLWRKDLIHDNWHLVCEVLKGIKDETKAALINLDQSKAIKGVDHRFLGMVLFTDGFKLEFRKRISMMCLNPLAVVQVKGRRLEAIAIERSVQQGCPLSSLLYVLTLEPLLLRLRDGAANPAQCGVPFTSCLRTKVSAYADDINVFVSRRSDIKAVKKVVERYKEEAGVKINFDKSEVLWLGA